MAVRLFQELSSHCWVHLWLVQQNQQSQHVQQKFPSTFFWRYLTKAVIRPYRHVLIIVRPSVRHILCYPFTDRAAGVTRRWQEYTCTVNSTWGGKKKKLFLPPPFIPLPSVHAKQSHHLQMSSLFWQNLGWNHKMVPARFTVLLNQTQRSAAASCPLSVSPPLSVSQITTTVSSQPLSQILLVVVVHTVPEATLKQAFKAETVQFKPSRMTKSACECFHVRAHELTSHAHTCKCVCV